MRIALTLLAALTATPLSAQVYENVGDLDTQIAVASGAAIGQAGGAAAPIDTRLKLARCPAPVSVELPYQGAFTLRCAPLGWRINVPMVATALHPAVLTVRRGDVVDLIVAGGSFEVSTSAVAVSDAATGQSLRVKIPTSGNVVTAVVTSAGNVRTAP
jgi:flagellar basal body P-ring formation protein FlgA